MHHGGEQPVWDTKMLNHTIILKVASGQFPLIDHLSSYVRDIVSRILVLLCDRESARGTLKSLCELVQ
jgi:hypothetical protein